MRIRLRDISLYFDVEGMGLEPCGSAMRQKPSFILIHGGPGFDHTGFKPAFSQLADIAQIFYLDVRGCGRSDRGDPAQWKLAEWSKDLAAFCDALEIGRPVVFGLSFGGYVAMQFALDYPELASGLVLSSTTARLRIDRALRVFDRLGGSRAREAAAQFWAAPSETTWAEYASVCLPLYNLRPAPPEVFGRVVPNHDLLFRYFTQGEEGRTFDLRQRLSALRCPTLLLAGHDDPITTIEDAQEIAAAIPSGLCQFETFEDCRHGTTRDAPERAFPIIRAFLERLNASQANS